MAKIKKTGRHTSAIKASRQAIRHKIRNIAKKEKMRTLSKSVLAAVAGKDQSKAGETFKKYSAEIDKAVKTGLLHWRNGARKKSYLARLTNKLAAPVGAAAAKS